MMRCCSCDLPLASGRGVCGDCITEKPWLAFLEEKTNRIVQLQWSLGWWEACHGQGNQLDRNEAVARIAQVREELSAVFEDLRRELPEDIRVVKTKGRSLIVGRVSPISAEGIPAKVGEVLIKHRFAEEIKS